MTQSMEGSATFCEWQNSIQIPVKQHENLFVIYNFLISQWKHILWNNLSFGFNTIVINRYPINLHYEIKCVWFAIFALNFLDTFDWFSWLRTLATCWMLQLFIEIISNIIQQVLPVWNWNHQTISFWLNCKQCNLWNWCVGVAATRIERGVATCQVMSIL